MDLETFAVMRAQEQMEAGSWRNEDREARQSPPKFKVNQPATGRCARWGCTRKVRCKGLCAEHYWQAKWQERKERAA